MLPLVLAYQAASPVRKRSFQAVLAHHRVRLDRELRLVPVVQHVLADLALSLLALRLCRADPLDQVSPVDRAVLGFHEDKRHSLDRVEGIRVDRRRGGCPYQACPELHAFLWLPDDHAVLKWKFIKLCREKIYWV